MKKDTTEKIKIITYLTNTEAEFVSLVPRGANKQPLKIAKNQGGTSMNEKVLYAIMTPEGIDIKESMPDLAGIINFDHPHFRTDKGEMFKQLDLEMCKADSFELVTLYKSDDGKEIQAVVAELANPEMAKEAAKIIKNDSGELTLEIAQEDKEFTVKSLFKPKSAKIPTVSVDGIEGKQVEKEYIDYRIEDELWSMQSVIYGVLEQSQGDMKTKIKMIENASANFVAAVKEYMGMTKSDGDFPAIEFKHEYVRKEKSVEPTEPIEPDKPEPEPVVKADPVQPDDTGNKVEPTESVIEPTEIEKLTQEMKKSFETINTSLADQIKALTEKLDDLEKKAELNGGEIAKLQRTVPGVVQTQTGDKLNKTPKKHDFEGSIFG